MMTSVSREKKAEGSISLHPVNDLIRVDNLRAGASTSREENDCSETIETAIRWKAEEGMTQRMIRGGDDIKYM